MDILEQCRIWNETGEEWETIWALEEIPEKDRTPEMDLELAHAYYLAADPMNPSDRYMLMDVISLLEPLEEHFKNDTSWNLLLGHSYKFLHKYGQALPYLKTAFKLDPDNTYTGKLIEQCLKQITLPDIPECFRQRTVNAWDAFAEREAEIRRMIDEDRVSDEKITEEIQGILNIAFEDITFGLCVKEKYELTLTPENEIIKLYELVYFQKHAPVKVLKHWDIKIGRYSSGDICLTNDDGWKISGDDVQIWLEEVDNDSFYISAYCEEILPLLSTAEEHAWWLLFSLSSTLLGEISFMRYIDFFEVLKKPKDSPSILLSQLPEKLREKGLDLSNDPEACLDTYISYEEEPDTDPDAVLRSDIVAGSTGCIQLLDDYMDGDSELVDELEADGAVAGFLVYPMETLMDGNNSKKFCDFNEQLEDVLSSGNCTEILTLIGFAAGVHFGYLDFIAWDFMAALDIAKAFFENSDIPWAAFHTFRLEAGSVLLKAPYDEKPTDYSHRN